MRTAGSRAVLDSGTKTPSQGGSRVAVRLVAVEGLDEGRIYDVTERGIFVFGREGEVLTRSGEPPQDGYTSRFHAVIEVAGAAAYVSDLRSKNRTWLNGRALA